MAGAGAAPAGATQARAGLGSQGSGGAVGLLGIVREWPPHTWFSPELPRTGSQATWPTPASRPQTHRGQSTAERPAAPGRGPSWLQATCSRRASGRCGGCRLGSSGAQAWQGEASIRRPSPGPARRTLPFSGILTPPPPRNPGPGVVRELPKPHPQPIPQSIHHHCIPSGENRSVLSGRVTARKARTPRSAPVGRGVGREARLIPGER